MSEFENRGSQADSEPEAMLPARQLSDGKFRAYVRMAALGDSATFGIGDRVGQSWRGWAALLAGAISGSHDVSFVNLARSGATISDVRGIQAPDACDHRPHIASLVVGINDTLRSWWDPDLARAQLLSCAAQLKREPVVLLTVRFHDHAQLLPLPRPLRNRLSRRIDSLNVIYGEIHDRFGGVQVDLRDFDAPRRREFWSVDRMHPSELGHRWLARAFSKPLLEAGLDFDPPSAACTGTDPTLAENIRWLVTQGGPWLGRRALDYGPWVARESLLRARLRAA